MTEKDRLACEGYGFETGTDAFANCMMQLDRDRKSQVTATLENWRQSNIEQQRNQEAYRNPYEPVLKTPVRTTCTTRETGWGVDRQTECVTQ